MTGNRGRERGSENAEKVLELGSAAGPRHMGRTSAINHDLLVKIGLA